MTIATGSTILATDYNTLVGGPTSTTANTFNVVWASGTANSGYGQTALANVAAGGTVLATEWAPLVSKTGNCGTHQNTSLISITVPVAGATIAASGSGNLANIQPNLNSVYAARLSAVSQSTTVANTVTRGTTWQNYLVYTHVVSFANVDAARYFFNSGGQLAVTASHPGGAAIDNILNALGSNIGTVVVSSVTSGTANIAGTLYNGVTKIGGGTPTPTTLATNSGYYGLGTANVSLFQQDAAGAGIYLDTFINITANTNSNGGGSGDKGNVIYIYTTWDEVGANVVTCTSGTTVTVTARVPETTNIANSWGTISVTGSITAGA